MRPGLFDVSRRWPRKRTRSNDGTSLCEQRNSFRLPFNLLALYYHQTPTWRYGHASTPPRSLPITGLRNMHFRCLWNGMFDRHRAEITHAVHRSLSSGASLCDGTVAFLPRPILSAKLAYMISSHNWPSEYALPPSLEWHVWSSSSGNNCHAIHRSLSSSASLCDGTVAFLPCPILAAKLYFTISLLQTLRTEDKLRSRLCMSDFKWLNHCKVSTVFAHNSIPCQVFCSSFSKQVPYGWTELSQCLIKKHKNNINNKRTPAKLVIPGGDLVVIGKDILLQNYNQYCISNALEPTSLLMLYH